MAPFAASLQMPNRRMTAGRYFSQADLEPLRHIVGAGDHASAISAARHALRRGWSEELVRDVLGIERGDLADADPV